MRKDKTTMDMLPDNWKEILFELSDAGRSIPSFIRTMGLTSTRHATLKADNPEYSEAIEEARLRCKVWWLEYGQDNLLTKGFNQGIFSFYMKNQFGWRDTPVSKENNDSILKDVEKDKELEVKFKKEIKETEQKLAH